MNEALLKILQEARDTIDERRKDTFIESAIILLEEEGKKPKPNYQYQIKEANPFKPEIMNTGKKEGVKKWWTDDNVTYL